MTIYFIRAGDSGNIKIGYTAGSAEKRMKQLQTGNIFDLDLLGTIPGEMQDEKSMHHELKDYALRGEWFRGEPELISLVHEMIENQHPWYFVRQPKVLRTRWERMIQSWVDAFSPMKDMDQASFEAPSDEFIGSRAFWSAWGLTRAERKSQENPGKEPWYLKRLKEEEDRLRAAQIQAIKAEAEAGIFSVEIPEAATILPMRAGDGQPWFLKRINEITNLRRSFQRREADARSVIETRKSHEVKSSVAA